ncbi:hypothetical protein ACSXAS_12515 [Clostridium perfringens]|uniref:hypothetical protein n=1 Tax=Clostridium perfringens TaxID=1502 RepID=UPI001FB86553|nr:hypothetical protein [Clostridium perfringens]
MNREQKEKVKKILRSYKTMKGQIECIDYEINITQECIEDWELEIQRTILLKRIMRLNIRKV